MQKRKVIIVNTDFGQEIRDSLKSLMIQRGLTQTQLATETGIPESTISRYLTGVHRPKVEYVAKMASAMGVSVDYLLGLSTSSIPNEPPRPEIRALISAYERADAHTKKMIWMQLDLVLTDEEKAFAPQFWSEKRDEAV